MSLCQRCLLRSDLCLCQQAPALSADLHLCLLTHEREPLKVTNTGRLLQASIPHCSVVIWQRRAGAEQITRLIDEAGRSPVLLFPEHSPPERAVADIMEEPGLTANVELPLFILLDATWQQATKMIRQSPYLQAMPKLSLNSATPSHYHLRRNQEAGNLSTVETGAALLRHCQLEGDARQLEAYFQRFLRHYEAHRSNHPVSSCRSTPGGAEP